ncbi:MAG TPA: cupin domain-containing protein [Gaiellaceae bacterium]|nr:cupin domain-containing protein [Gaiellaceae bacterium]
MAAVPPLQGSSIAGTDFTIAEWVDDGESSADRPIAPAHVHFEDDEAWYVLEGALGFRRGGEHLEAPAGAAVLVPRGVVHTFWNAGGGRCRYLIVLTPRLAALLAGLHEPGVDIPKLFARYASALAE